MELQAFCTGFPLLTGEQGIKIKRTNSISAEFQENESVRIDQNQVTKTVWPDLIQPVQFSWSSDWTQDVRQGVWTIFFLELPLNFTTRDRPHFVLFISVQCHSLRCHGVNTLVNRAQFAEIGESQKLGISENLAIIYDQPSPKNQESLKLSFP